MKSGVPAGRSRGRAFSAFRPARWLLLAAVVIVGAALAWISGARALAHYYAQWDPRAALAAEPNDPEALSSVADRIPPAGAPAKAFIATEAAARRSLVVSPLQAEAIRDLGVIADTRGQQPLAATIMERAGRRGFRDVPTQSWLMRQALLGRDYERAVLHLNVILLTTPGKAAELFPSLAVIVNDPGAIGPLSHQLVTNPPWRAPALLYLSTRARNLTPVARIYDSLAKSARPPTNEEANALLLRMTRDRRYQEAYLLWISYLPQRVLGDLGDVYDGGFQGLPGPLPFNWNFFQAPGVIIEFAKPSTSPSSALHVDYPVSGAQSLAAQLLVLPAGSFRLSGRFMITRPAAGAHLEWTVACADAPTQLITTTRENGAVASGWTPFSVTFTVPDNCSGQWLRLEGLPGDGFGELSAWYGDLQIQPAADSAVTAAGAGAPSPAAGDHA